MTLGDDLKQVISAGEAIMKARDLDDILDVANLIVLPAEETIHWQRQFVHQQKRQKAGITALKRITSKLVGVKNSVKEDRESVLKDKRFLRFVRAALSPIIISSRDLDDLADKRIYIDTLKCLASLVGNSKMTGDLLFIVLDSVTSVLNTDAFLMALDSYQIDTLEWATEKLLPISGKWNHNIVSKRSQLNLPWRIMHQQCAKVPSVKDIKKEVPFVQEELLTRDGKSVLERRHTCWMAEEGIEGLAYSGKVMAPTPFTPLIGRIRDELYRSTNEYYDCALLNYYDGDSACKMHADPDMGTMWERSSIIVSIGETRRFHFKKILDISEQHALQGRQVDNTPFAYHLFDGDCIHMFDNCNDLYNHAVLKSEGTQNLEPRVSIVFKKAIDKNGRKGHALRNTSRRNKVKSGDKRRFSSKNGKQKPENEG